MTDSRSKRTDGTARRRDRRVRDGLDATLRRGLAGTGRSRRPAGPSRHAVGILALLLVAAGFVALGPVPLADAHTCPVEAPDPTDPQVCPHSPDIRLTSLAVLGFGDASETALLEAAVTYENNASVHEEPTQAVTMCNNCTVEDPFQVGILATTAPLATVDGVLIAEFLTPLGFQTFGALKTQTEDMAVGATSTKTFTEEIGNFAVAGQTLTLLPVADYCLTIVGTVQDWTSAGPACAVNETANGGGVQSEVNVADAQRLLVEPLPLEVAATAPSTGIAENSEGVLTLSLANGAGFNLLEFYAVELLDANGTALPVKVDGSSGGFNASALFTSGIPAGPSTAGLRFRTSGLVGDEDLTVRLTYPATTPNILNPATRTANVTVDVATPDFVPTVTADPTAVRSATSETVTFTLEVANEGGAGAAEVGHAAFVNATLDLCDRLKGSSPCDPDVDADWRSPPLGTASFAAANLSAGGSDSADVMWDPADGDVSLFAARGTADSDGDFPEDDEDNNRRAGYAQASTVWVDPVNPTGQATLAAQTTSHLLTITNKGTQTQSYTVQLLPASSVKHRCDPGPCSAWGAQVLTPGGQPLTGPITIAKDQTAQVRVNVTAPTGSDFRAGFSEFVVAVCQGGCQVSGGVVGPNVTASGAVVRTDIPENRGPRIGLLGTANRQAAAGDTVRYHFTVRNDGTVADRFNVTGAITPTSPSQDATVAFFDDSGAEINGTAFLTRHLEPTATQRFRFDVRLGSGIPDGTTVQAVLAANSQSAVENGTTAATLQLLTIGIGTDVTPPTVEPDPPGGSAVRPGTDLTYTISDESGVTSVTRSLGGGPFHTFEAPYVLNTSARPDGLLEVRIRAVDGRGNTADRTFEYFVDSTEPTFQSVLLEPQVPWAGGPIRVITTLEDPTLATVSVTIGDTTRDLVEETAGGTVASGGNGGGGGGASGDGGVNVRDGPSVWSVPDLAAPSEPDLYELTLTATDGAGNQATTTREVDVVLPDVRIAGDDVTVEPRAPRADETVRIVAQVTNPSAAEVPNYDVALLVDGSEHRRVTVTLASAAKTQVSFEWSGPAGDHDAQIVADPDQQVLDADRDSNAHPFTIQVRSQGLLGIPGPETYIIAAALVLTALGLGRRRWDARDACEDEGYP